MCVYMCATTAKPQRNDEYAAADARTRAGIGRIGGTAHGVESPVGDPVLNRTSSVR